MCRLFGLRANRPVDLAFSFTSGERTFPQFAGRNPDGFGVGWYRKSKPDIYKRPYRADESEKLAEWTCSGQSATWIAHVRNATTGIVSNQNCHPFRFNNWLFAHNGSIEGRETLQASLQPSHQSAIDGQTDSEVYFHWLLQNIESERDINAGVRCAVAAVSGYSGLNFILTDGNSLYAYRNASTNLDYYSLYFLERDPQRPGPERLMSEELRLLIESKSLRHERAVLICSEPLTGEDWRLIPKNHLLIVRSDMNTTLNRI